MGAPEVPQGTSGTKSPRALAISEKAFGPEHPETNRTRSNIQNNSDLPQ
jgi:hypothetical protein